MSKAKPMRTAGQQSMRFAASGPLTGTLSVPGDKSISHRALILAAMAAGRSQIIDPSEGLDVASTAAALGAMGVRIARNRSEWTVDGVGTGCLLQPAGALDMGNSGTSARLLMGLVASHRVSATFIGDASLSRRPMARVIEPLRRMGADISASPGDRLPLSVRGLCPAVPHHHRLEIASAQVKSALLLAALNTPGATRVSGDVPTRDHSERMLRQFGADILVSSGEEGYEIALRGEAELAPQRIEIPGDFSSAAFLIVAATLVPGSELRLENVGVNPMRTGLLRVLEEMGADIQVLDQRVLGNEPVADIEVRHAPLRGIRLPPSMVPSMIDEYPIFFIAAAFAAGESRATGLSELRVKESDRIAAMAAGLASIGVRVEEEDDGLVLHGSGGAPLTGGGTIASRLDHRIAMSFAVAGLHSREPITVDDMSPADTSFPGFAAALSGLSAQ